MATTLDNSLEEYVFNVSDEEPLFNVHSPKEKQFRPQLAKVVFRDGKFQEVFVFGPLISRGKTLMKQGVNSWNHTDLDEPDENTPMPAWVRDMIEKAKSL